MKNEINLNLFWRVLKKSFWKILIFAIVVMVAVALYAQYFIPKRYSSSIGYLAFSISSSNTTGSNYAQGSLSNVEEYLIRDYSAIIKSEKMCDRVAQKLKEKHPGEDGKPETGKYGYITAGHISGMVSTAAGNAPSAFTLTVSSTDPQLAYDVCLAFEEVAPDVITEVTNPFVGPTTEEFTNSYYGFLRQYVEDYKNSTDSNETLKNLLKDENILKDFLNKDNVEYMVEEEDLGSDLVDRGQPLSVLKKPVRDTAPDSPNIPLYTATAGMVAALGLYLYFFIRQMINVSIVSEDDVQRLISLPLIGTIPEWETSSSYGYAKANTKY